MHISTPKRLIALFLLFVSVSFREDIEKCKAGDF